MDLLQRSVAEYEKEFEMLEKYQITDPQDPDFGGYYNKGFRRSGAELRLGRGKTDDAVFLPSEPVLQRPPRTGLRRRPGTASSEPPAPRRHDGLLFLQFSLCAGHSVCHTGAGKARQAGKGRDTRGKSISEKLFLVLRRMGDGMVEEGFHTPNHRWVISAALALLNTLMPDERYVARIDQYLAEHIDCNEDGGICRAFSGRIQRDQQPRVADFGAGSGKKTELLEYVRRNLEMMPVFYHTDFSIFTENSVGRTRAPHPTRKNMLTNTCCAAMHCMMRRCAP